MIVGAMKAATTSLYSYLKQHPDIFMPEIKEPKFFNNLAKDQSFKLEGKGLKKITTFQQYYSLFKNAKNQTAIGEASPSYLFDKECASLIHTHLPKVKIIIVLRQPIDRAYSHFLHAKRADKERISSFELAFTEKERREKKKRTPHYYKEKGYYTEQVKRYYELFPEENIKIILFEELTNSPTKVSQEIFQFLNIDSSFCPNTKKKENVSGVPKGIFGWAIMKLRYYNLMPDIQFSKYLPGFIIDLISKLAYKKKKPLKKSLRHEFTHRFYKDDILQLQKIINKDLKNWLS